MVVRSIIPKPPIEPNGSDDPSPSDRAFAAAGSARARPHEGAAHSVNGIVYPRRDSHCKHLTRECSATSGWNSGWYPCGVAVPSLVGLAISPNC
jgi:hypothetical protein